MPTKVTELKGNCGLITHQCWQQYKQRDGRICIGLAKTINGDYEKRCHWWYEIDGTAITEFYNLSLGVHEVTEISADTMDNFYDNIHKYTNDEYQWYIDIFESLKDLKLIETIPHLKCTLILEHIKRNKPKAESFTRNYLLNLAGLLKIVLP